MLDKNIVKRLAFIKYLYEIAIEQSQKPEPLGSASILTFHNAIELFLQLASEYLGIGKKEPSFMEYWEILASKLPAGMPTQKESMRRLNRARVALKHHGILPSKLDIEAFRASATNFFEENTPPIFDTEFSEISLIDLVQCEETKNSLKEAIQLMKQSKIEESLDKVAIAFAQLIDDYENRKRGQFGRSPFFFGESLTRWEHSSFQDVDEVIKSIEALQDAVKIISLRIDYRRYAKFRLLTPNIVRSMDGTYIVFKMPHGSKATPTVEDFQFCIDFVIESSITLTEFDFSIEKH
jgi:hypothetical protein